MCVKDFNYDKTFTQIKKHTLDISKNPSTVNVFVGFFLLFLILLFGIDDFGSASKG